MSMNILNKIANQKINKLIPDELLTVQSFGISIFNGHELPNRRKLDEFLVDFHDESSTGMFDDDAMEANDDEEADYQDIATMQAMNEINFSLDAKYRKVMKAHQFEGLQFMWDRVYKKKQGCLLAHSMGLGKSLQTIALLTTMYQYLKRYPSSKFPTGNRVLIIAPLITLTNWVNEFSKWSISDSQNVIGEVFNIAEVGSSARMRYLKYWYVQGGIMLINYDQYRALLSKKDEKGKEDYFKMLVNPGADVIILDEGHRIKNSTTHISTLINQVRTRSRICLTGYPLQNHLSEYYDMINFIAPNLLGSPDKFKSYFSNIIERCYVDSSKNTKHQAAMKMYVLQILTDSVTHRRNETILSLDLPPKTEYVVRFKMNSVQFEGYQELIKVISVEAPLVGLLALRAMCNHPKIFQSLLKHRQEKERNEKLSKGRQTQAATEEGDDSVSINEDEIMEEISSVPAGAVDGALQNQETFDSDIVEDNEQDVFEKWLALGFHFAIEYLEKADIESWKASGKMSFIVDLVKECQIVKDKVVLVSHSIACLDYVQKLLPVFGSKLCRIDGTTPGSERQTIVDRFQSDESYSVMLLSAKAAAIGINLTAANRVVLIDQDWNPLYDEQSIGRIFRYGQTKPVFVYRLITSSTIEERIFTQSIHKRSISRRVIDNKASLAIAKNDLTKYYTLPSEDIELISLDDTSEDIKKDGISYKVLTENAACISGFEAHDQTLVDANGETTLFTINNPDDRAVAKEEARFLLREYKETQRK
ncbi:uncharacterized protein ATC70_007491 [Mucor velutinosus]|uniref:Uncharacterized protein n=1 Tax=Mucor velutinosus TaxID=708070 RepID=A0AAN7D725_9FUNG|nr:hypothetical protein ATC70_007491 [Mucor velutinosus]